MKKILLSLILVGALSSSYAQTVDKQQKPYYIGKHLAGLQYSYMLIGFEAQYAYVFNPMQKFMWLGKASIGYSLIGEPSPYYHIGGEMLFGRKSRLLLGLGFDYNNGYYRAQLFSTDIGYTVLGKKHLNFSVIYRMFYEPFCNCPELKFPFYSGFDVLFSLSWAF